MSKALKCQAKQYSKKIFDEIQFNDKIEYEEMINLRMVSNFIVDL